MMRFLRLQLVLLSILLLPPAALAGGEYGSVRVKLLKGPTPFKTVMYQVVRVGKNAAVCQEHGYAHPHRDEDRCKLIPLERWEKLVSDLEAHGVFKLAEEAEKNPYIFPVVKGQSEYQLPPETPDNPLAHTYRLDAAWGGKRASWVVRGPFILGTDQAPGSILEAVAVTVQEATGREVWLDIAWPDAKLGVATIWSHPWAEIWLDGKPLGMRTPALSLDLPAGWHHLWLIRKDKGIDRRGRIKVLPGKSVNFLLGINPNKKSTPSDVPGAPEELKSSPDTL